MIECLLNDLYCEAQALGYEIQDTRTKIIAAENPEKITYTHLYQKSATEKE